MVGLREAASRGCHRRSPRPRSYQKGSGLVDVHRVLRPPAAGDRQPRSAIGVTQRVLLVIGISRSSSFTGPACRSRSARAHPRQRTHHPPPPRWAAATPAWWCRWWWSSSCESGSMKRRSTTGAAGCCRACQQTGYRQPRSSYQRPGRVCGGWLTTRPRCRLRSGGRSRPWARRLLSPTPTTVHCDAAAPASRWQQRSARAWPVRG